MGISSAAADPLLREKDSVHEAGQTLSRHLDGLKADLEQVRRYHAIEQERVRILALLAQRRPPQASSLGQGGLGWLISRNDPASTGIQPVPGREGLLVSYEIPVGDPLGFFRGNSWSYDNAVGAIALVAQGKREQALKILRTLEGLMAPDGSLGFSYRVDSDSFDPHVRTGTMAWVGYAFLRYQRATGESRFQSSAVKVGDLLLTLKTASGSLKGGPDVSWISTEHNADALIFLRDLQRVTADSRYREAADGIQSSLLTHHWDPVQRRFLRGIGDPVAALDANVLMVPILVSIGRTEQARQALRYVERTFRNSQRITGSNVRIWGYSPDAARRTVWLEGTLMTALAYRAVGQKAKVNQILGQVARIQQVWTRQGRWRGALPYAMPRYIDADGDTFSEKESAPSTGWLLLAIS